MMELFKTVFCKLKPSSEVLSCLAGRKTLLTRIYLILRGFRKEFTKLINPMREFSKESSEK